MRSILMTIVVLLHSVCMSAEPVNVHDAADNVVVPDYSSPYAEYSSNDPSGEFDIERAAQFIDGVAVKWGEKHGCVTCHTNGYYLMVPPKIFKLRPAVAEVRNFAEGWINSWEEIGLPRTEIVVAPAAFLTINNMQMDGKLRPATRKALGEAWKLQSEEGNWEIGSNANGRLSSRTITTA